MISLPPLPVPANPPVASSPSASGEGPPSPLHGEVPFFLTVEDCPLYAVYHPVPGGAAAPMGVVIVPPISAEQLSGYRSEVLLARVLAREGVASIRFHPRGQGDSGGDSAMLTLPSLVTDTRAAFAELARRSGTRRMVGVGVRFGALVLAAAIAAGETPEALVLWEPVHESQGYFRELLRSVLFSDAARGRRSGLTVESMRESLQRDGQVDVLGYPLHRALVESAGEGLAARLAPWRGPTLLAQIDSRRTLAKPHAALAESLRARGVPVDVREVRSELSWFFLQNPAWESAELVDATARWILAHA